MIGLFLSWIIIYLFCKVLKINYDQIVGGAYDAIRVVVPTLCLLMSIGVMIGTWLQSGTIASIIVGGLKMINPTWLLPLTLVFCAVLSLVTGTSYGSVGSAGVAMMAIGNAMGIHPGMVAGAVICGAMFGDKLSPLSDTTNLAPAVAGSKLNDHVRSMLWTTLRLSPSAWCCLPSWESARPLVVMRRATCWSTLTRFGVSLSWDL